MKNDMLTTLVIGGFAFAILLIVMSINKMDFGGTSPQNNDEFALRYVAEQRLKDSLKDPASLEIISYDVDENKNVTIQYRAKNSFGAMITDTFYTK